MQIDIPEDRNAESRIKAILDIAASTQDKERRKAIAQRILVWKGNARHLVKPMPAEDLTHFAGKPKLTPPLLAHALRQISFLYDIPPHRMSSTKDEWEKLFWSYGGSGFNGSLHSALPLAKLCGQVHAWFHWVRSPNEPLDIDRVLAGRSAGMDPEAAPRQPGIVTDLYTSDQVIALPLSTDQRFSSAVMLLHSVTPVLRGDQHHPIADAVREVWHYFDDLYYAQISHVTGTNDWAVEPRPEGSHLVPHHLPGKPVLSMPWRHDPSQRQYWVDPWGGDDLLPNLGEVFTQLSEYLWTARLQRGQPVGRKVTRPPLGPDLLVELGDDPNSMFNIIPNNANLTGMRDSVTTALELLAKTLGLPSRTFRLDDVSAMSGIAIALDSGELEDQRRGDEQTWRRTEDASADMVAPIAEIHGKVALASDVTTAFSPLTPILTQDQRQQLVLVERGQQTMSKKEMKTTLHPDLPDHAIDDLLLAADKEFSGQVPDETDEAGPGALPSPQSFPPQVDG